MTSSVLPPTSSNVTVVTCPLSPGCAVLLRRRHRLVLDEVLPRDHHCRIQLHNGHQLALRGGAWAGAWACPTAVHTTAPATIAAIAYPKGPLRLCTSDVIRSSFCVVR
jgi:hypothetical protein